MSARAVFLADDQRAKRERWSNALFGGLVAIGTVAALVLTGFMFGYNAGANDEQARQVRVDRAKPAATWNCREIARICMNQLRKKES